MGIRHKIVALFLGFCVSAALCPAASGLQVKDAEIEWHKYYDNVFINTSNFVNPDVKLYPNKLVITFKNAKAGSFTTSSKKSPRIASVRFEQINKDTARVVINLKKPIKYELASLYGKNQVVIEVAESQDKMPIAAFEQEAVKPEVKTVPIAIKVLAPVKSKHKKIGKPLLGKIIVVDPGHGGSDPGAFGVSGTREKALTLKTARYLAKYLKSNGATVFLTRKSDIKKDLPDICDYANKLKADIYIGVHYNSIDNKKVSGTETYYYMPQSYRLAALVHKEMLLSLKRRDQGIKRAMLYTIHHANMPAIIVEPVYISDMQEDVLARSESFQKEVASAVARGVKDYYSR